MGCECMHEQGQLFAYDRQETLRKACVSLWAYLQNQTSSGEEKELTL